MDVCNILNGLVSLMFLWHGGHCYIRKLLILYVCICHFAECGSVQTQSSLCVCVCVSVSAYVVFLVSKLYVKDLEFFLLNY